MHEKQITGLGILIAQESLLTVVEALWIICMRNDSEGSEWQKRAEILAQSLQKLRVLENERNAAKAKAGRAEGIKDKDKTL